MSFNIKKLNPWNWLKKDDTGERDNIPVNRKSNLQKQNRGIYSQSLNSIHEEIDQIFNNAFQAIKLPLTNFNSNFPGSYYSVFRPHLDISSTEKEYHINVEIPGVEEQNICVELNADNALIIRGNKEQHNEKNTYDFHWIERLYGSFQRVLALPEDADQENIKGKFMNGVLTLIIPRKALQKSDMRKIPIISEEHKKD